MDDLLHLVEISFQSFASLRGNSILGTRYAAFETLGAHHVVCILELARMDAQIAISCLEQTLQLRKGQRITHSKSANDPQAHSFVNDGIELGRRCLFLSCKRARGRANI